MHKNLGLACAVALCVNALGCSPEIILVDETPPCRPELVAQSMPAPFEPRSDVATLSFRLQSAPDCMGATYDRFGMSMDTGSAKNPYIDWTFLYGKGEHVSPALPLASGRAHSGQFMPLAKAEAAKDPLSFSVVVDLSRESGAVFGGVNLDSYWVTMPSGLSYYIAGQDHIPLIRGEGGLVK